MTDVRPLNLAFLSSLLLASLLLIGCDTNDTSADGEITAVEIRPATASIEPGDREDFSVILRDAAGNPLEDADVNIRWWSTDTTVFKVSEDGAATGKNEGTAYCIVEATTLAKAARFVGRDSAFVTVLF